MHPILFEIPLHLVFWVSAVVAVLALAATAVPDKLETIRKRLPGRGTLVVTAVALGALAYYLRNNHDSLPIYSYGVMLGTSLIIAWYVIMWLGTTKENLDKELMANCFIVTAIAALVGARLLYILTNLGEFDSPAKWLDVRSGGLVAYGGFLGGFVGSFVYMRRKKVPLVAWADVVSPTLGLGLFFTRIGCYMYGCDFGKRLGGDAPSWLKWLGTFPHWANDKGAPAWSHHVARYGLSQGAHASLPVHPTQIYESLVGLALFGITMLVWRKRSFRGQVLCVLVMAYGTWRFFVEMLRDDPERGGALGFSTSQLISLALVPIAGLAYVMLRKRARELGEQPIPSVATGAASPAAPQAAEAGSSSSSVVKRKKPAKKRK